MALLVCRRILFCDVVLIPAREIFHQFDGPILYIILASPWIELA